MASHDDTSDFGPLTDFEDSIRDFLGAEPPPPRKVNLASVHRNSFSQQLTGLQRPGFTDTMPPTQLAQALGRKTSLREVDILLM
jgi:hypothetical protein